ncbi:MAG TPA: 30S ribosomal protein S8e [Candidatus Bathyarchaeota archaeon]|nr:30S ribosomal protein S8e [Candidatus Bathyarchaeota archaeon]
MHKRKRTGGRRRPYRKKRKYEMGSFPTETVLGPDKRKVDRRKGGNIKVRVFSTNKAVVSDPETGKSQLAEILRVVKNPANVDYDRRGVITKGCIIETSLGLAKVTSRPGQHGVVNAVLLKEQS